MDSTPISKLLPELLLKVFDILSQDPTATVTHSVLCCRRWEPLARSVLYRDTFLDQSRLSKFARQQGSGDYAIQSLTVRLGPLPVNPLDPQVAIETAQGWLDDTRKVAGRVCRMLKLESCSVSMDVPLPYSPSEELGLLLRSLPGTCTAVEIDLRHSSFVQSKLGTVPPPSAHLCDDVRAMLGRLHHLRLRLPKICSAVVGSEDEENPGQYKAADAPQLRDCIINITQRIPGTSPRVSLSASCASAATPHIGSQTLIPPVLPPLAPALQIFARATKPRLERLWVIDAQAAGQGKNSWAAWVRRDILADASWPVPVANIGGFRGDGWFARVPVSSRPQPEVEDKLAAAEILEGEVEGFAWSESLTGVRLPAPIMLARGWRRAAQPLTRAELGEEDGLSCALWLNESMTGQMLLPVGPGSLMQPWDLNERTPSGWKRENFRASPMTRL